MSKVILDISTRPQPTEDTCGPTCLEAVYNYYSLKLNPKSMFHEIPMLEDGGTFNANLGSHALKNGFQVDLYSYNLKIFDPSWVVLNKEKLVEKIEAQSKHKGKDKKLVEASKSYVEFLQSGGQMKFFQDLSFKTLKDYLDQGAPIIAGLSSTYLYQVRREDPKTMEDDDVRGYPAGHFLVVKGYEAPDKLIVSDPFRNNPLGGGGDTYEVDFMHFSCAVLPGVVTYDANLLAIYPGE